MKIVGKAFFVVSQTPAKFWTWSAVNSEDTAWTGLVGHPGPAVPTAPAVPAMNPFWNEPVKLAVSQWSRLAVPQVLMDGWPLRAQGHLQKQFSNSAQSLPGKGFQTLAAGNDLGSSRYFKPILSQQNVGLPTRIL